MIENNKILVVEDEIIIAEDIQNTLNRLGYDVCGVVSSGEESVERAFQTNPDLILMDIKIRGNMDGLSAAKQIQSQFNIPVIFLTAYGEDIILKQIDKMKPFSYISKPFEEKDLRLKIDSILKSYKKVNCN